MKSDRPNLQHDRLRPSVGRIVASVRRQAGRAIATGKQPAASAAPVEFDANRPPKSRIERAETW